MLPDYYNILGITSDADIEMIKRAFRRLALTYHPDKNKSPNSHDKFIEINEAYLILSDVEAKTRYDEQYQKQKVYSDDLKRSMSTEASTLRYDDIIYDWIKKARDQSIRYSRMSFSDFIKIIPEVGKEIGFQGSQIIMYTISGVFFTSGFFSIIFGEFLFGIISFAIGIYGLTYTSNRWDKKRNK